MHMGQSGSRDRGVAEGRPLGSVQRFRKVVLLAIAAAAVAGLLVSDSMFPGGGVVHEAIEYGGIALLLVCMAGRLWSTLYIAGRKKVELVQVGPYSICRNPLYLFSIVGAAGVGAATGSLVGIAFAGLACYAVFAVVVAKEERFLGGRFGAAFADYRARVPRFLPRLSQWRDVPLVEVDPRLVMASVRDAALFFLAIPLVESIEHLHLAGILPAWFLVP